MRVRKSVRVSVREKERVGKRESSTDSGWAIQ